MNCLPVMPAAQSALGAAQNKPSILAVLTELEQSMSGALGLTEDLRSRLFTIMAPASVKEAAPEPIPIKSDLVLHRLQDLVANMDKLQGKLYTLIGSVAL